MSTDHTTRLKGLHLYGMAVAWTELQAEQPRQVHRPETWMERLILAEQTDRQTKSLRYQIKSARFPIHRDLLGIDWAETPLQQSVIEQLATGAFMQPHTTSFWSAERGLEKRIWQPRSAWQRSINPSAYVSLMRSTSSICWSAKKRSVRSATSPGSLAWSTP